MLKSSEIYEKAGREIMQTLRENECTSCEDICIILNWLTNRFHCLGDGRYLYERKFYNSIDSLPDKGKEQYECSNLIDEVLKTTELMDVRTQLVLQGKDKD